MPKKAIWGVMSVSDNNEVVRPATMQDVAKVAGVSRGTVSRYVRRNGYVSQEAAEAIEAAIVSTRFVPNAVARTLAGFPSRNVALVVHEDASLFAQDPNLMGMMIGARRRLHEMDYQLLIIIENELKSTERLQRTLTSGLVDGVMVAAPKPGDPLAEVVRKSNLPAVYIGQDESFGDLPVVDIDNRDGGKQATECLVADRVKFPAHIAGPAQTYAALQRVEGFRDVLGKRSELLVHSRDWSMAAGAQAMRTLLEQEPRVDGVFAACDAIAIGAIDELRRAGRKVPQDVKVVGFDDSPWALSNRPALTTISQPAEVLGEQMAEMVLRQLRGEDMHGVVELVPVKLVQRESA